LGKKGGTNLSLEGRRHRASTLGEELEKTEEKKVEETRGPKNAIGRI